MLERGRLSTEEKKLWHNLEDMEKDVILYLVHAMSSLAIDDLVSLSGTPIQKVLNVVEMLKKRGIIYEKKESGKGFYFLGPSDMIAVAQHSTPEERMREILIRMIEFYSPSVDDPKISLVISELFQKLRNTTGGLRHLLNAADILARSGKKEKAVLYYDLILKHFTEKKVTSNDSGAFIDSVLGKISIMIRLMPLEEQLSLLKKAQNISRRHGIKDRLAKIELALGMVLQAAGKPKEASRCIDDCWRLAEETGDRGLIKSIALGISEYLLWSGRFSEGASRYEEVVGDLEEFGDNEETLRVGALLGLCNCICGRFARGMGMIETVRNKARLLNFQRAIAFAEFLSALCFIEIRRIPETEAILNRLSSLPEHLFDHHVLWGINECKAYIHCMKGNYSKAFEHQQKGFEHSRFTGWKHYPGSWTFEYRDILESKGFVHKDMNYDSVIELMLKWDDIYMRGVALRYRAMRDIKRNSSLSKILLDLQKSEEYLVQAGTELELARTRIALGEYYMKKGKMKTARSYLEKAWTVLSKIDEDLFPKELLAIMPRERKIEVMLERITKINESLGKIQDKSTFIERVIDVAMDFTMAMHGAFLTREAGSKLKMITSRNLDPVLLNAVQSEQITSLIENAFKKGLELIFPDPENKKHPIDGTFHKAGIHSLIAMPVILDKEIKGYLCLNNRFDGTPFPENQLPYIRLLCNLIAVGLSNISMYEALKSRFAEKEEETIFYKKEMGIVTPINMIIGRSQSMETVIDQINQVAPTDSSVLILGETGVGKELVSKAIHSLSNCKDGPFIPVNLASLPQELVASELFGYEKGAFTGANERHKGRFELADGGTIFLDEIGDLPPSMQMKLLRVLQEKTFERLGSTKPIHSNFRLIATTNKNLALDVERGAFRQDLFYRLNVFPIYVPPLRVREEDIPLLAHHFFKKYTTKMGKKLRRLPTEELNKLLHYPWPGNVRELEHVVERAVILSDGNRICFPDLYHPSDNQGVGKEPDMIPLTNMERTYIENVLNATGWRVRGPKGAALILGLKPTTLFFRMKKLGIKKPEIPVLR